MDRRDCNAGHNLTSERLALLIGDEYIQSAIFPAGLNLVTVVSSPAPTLVYGIEEHLVPTDEPAVETAEFQADAEERVLDIVPIEDDENEQEQALLPGEAKEQQDCGALMSPKNATAVEADGRNQQIDNKLQSNSNEGGQPSKQPFSVFRCLSDPYQALAATKAVSN